MTKNKPEQEGSNDNYQESSTKEAQSVTTSERSVQRQRNLPAAANTDRNQASDHAPSAFGLPTETQSVG